MFIGHFGIGFGAKSAAPKVSLGSLFLAAQFIDLLWPTLLLLGKWLLVLWGYWIDKHRHAPADDRQHTTLIRFPWVS